MRNWTFLLLGAVLLLAGCTARIDAGEGLTVKIQRDFKVGQDFGIDANGEQAISVDNVAKPSLTGFACSMTGKVHIVAVSEATRQPTQFECTVESCVANGQALLKKGDVIIATMGADRTTVYSVGGKKVKDGVRDVLDVCFTSILPVLDGDPAIDESNFGTKVPRKNGDKWDVNAADVAGCLKKALGIDIVPADVSGNAALTEVVGDSMHVAGYLNLAHMKMGDQNVADANMQQWQDWELPQDGALPQISSTVAGVVNMSRKDASKITKFIIVRTNFRAPAAQNAPAGDPAPQNPAPPVLVHPAILDRPHYVGGLDNRRNMVMIDGDFFMDNPNRDKSFCQTRIGPNGAWKDCESVCHGKASHYYVKVAHNENFGDVQIHVMGSDGQYSRPAIIDKTFRLPATDCK